MKLSLVFSLLLGFFVVSAQGASVFEVKDILSMQVQDDGSFNVICKNGTFEHVSAKDVTDNNVCPHIGSSPLPIPIKTLEEAQEAVFQTIDSVNSTYNALDQADQGTENTLPGGSTDQQRIELDLIRKLATSCTFKVTRLWETEPQQPLAPFQQAITNPGCFLDVNYSINGGPNPEEALTVWKTNERVPHENSADRFELSHQFVPKLNDPNQPTEYKNSGRGSGWVISGLYGDLTGTWETLYVMTRERGEWGLSDVGIQARYQIQAFTVEIDVHTEIQNGGKVLVALLNGKEMNQAQLNKIFGHLSLFGAFL